MAARDLRFIVLGEDATHINFVVAWLRAEGIERRQITPRNVAADASGGAGEQFVRQNYAAEVQYYRAKANHQRVALVVVVDADTATLARRHEALAQALATAGFSPREADERIAIFVPRRNAETWLRVLTGSTCDEETDYKPMKLRPSSEAMRESGRAFQALLRGQATPGELPSLHAARGEAARLK